MTTRRSRIASTMLVVVLIVIGCLTILAHSHIGQEDTGGAVVPPTPSRCPSQSQGAYIEPSYATGPTNLHELKGMSDLVAEVSIASLVRTESDGPDVFSIFMATVVMPIAGKHAAGITVGSAITIRQLGGHVGCTLYQVPSDPLMQPGERDILFLQQWPGVYDIVNDTVGRFVVNGDGQIAPNTYTVVALAPGLTDAAFIRQIQSA